MKTSPGNTSLALRPSNDERRNSDETKALDTRHTPAQLSRSKIIDENAVGERAQSMTTRAINFAVNAPLSVQVLAAETLIVLGMHPHWWMVKGFFIAAAGAAAKDAYQIITLKNKLADEKLKNAKRNGGE